MISFKKLSGWTAATLACGFMLSAVAANAKKAQVYIFSGQSNMQGSGLLAELPENYKQPQQKVFYWDNNTFVPLEPGKVRTSNPRTFGPEISFASTFRRFNPDTPLYIIKNYSSGKGLHRGWDNQKWEGEAPGPERMNFYPGEKPNDRNVGVHYRDLAQATQAGLKALKDSGVDYEVAGIVWVQGEQDGKNKVSAGQYAANLKQFKQRLQQDAGSGDVPLIYVQVLPFIEPFPSTGSRFPQRDLVREQMAKADARSGDAVSIPNAYMVPASGLPLNDDLVHYNTLGQLLLGEELALAAIQAQVLADWNASKGAMVQTADNVYAERNRRVAERQQQQQRQQQQRQRQQR